MNDFSPRANMLAEWLTKLVGPGLLLITGITLLIFDNIIDPPGEPQGTSGIASVIVTLALGRGFDKIDKLRGRE